ncbi:MAG: hypothetical protein KA165_14095 [Saprospiraceae bacterium]|nr:hypothetical protein [Saprospiraceae bacterium]
MPVRPALLIAGFLFCFTTSASSQIHHRPPLDPKLANYFKSVNLAARAIYDNDFAGASAHYEEAFRNKTYPFYADLKNAVIVNSKCGFFGKNNALLKILLDQKRIDTTQLFLELPPRLFDANNRAFIRTCRPEKNATRKNDDILKYEFYTIFSDDQGDVLTQPDVNNVQSTRFIELYRKYGFPTEEKIGCFTEDHTENWQNIQVLMQNFIKHRDADAEKILQILQTEFEKGNIPPSVLANCYDCKHDNSKEHGQEYYFQNELVVSTNKKTYRPFIYYSDSIMTVINTNRLSIGLDSFHVAQKQFICSKFCDIPGCTDPKSSTIQPVSYINISILPFGFVKAAFEKEKQDLAWYQIQTEAAAVKCACEKKQY